jgi:hypothetical protein
MKYKIFIITAMFAALLSNGKTYAQINFTKELNDLLLEENVEQRLKSADTFCSKLANAISVGAKAEKIDILQRVSQLFSDDKNIGIYTWSVPTERGMYKYYGIVKSPNGIFILQDANTNNKYMLDEKFTNENWYGAVYFDLVETDINGKKAYTLLGNDLKGIMSNKKVIDVLSFDDNGKPVFGAAIFDDNNSQRLIFEYNARSVMHMQYNRENEMIIYSILVPMSPEFEDDYRFYIPDIFCDGLKYKDGKWIRIENVEKFLFEQ